MPQNNRPTGREKNVTGSGKSIYRRGSGNGGGPVGGSSTSGRPSSGASGGASSGRPVTRSGSGKGGLIGIILAVVALLGGGGGLLGGLLGGSAEPIETAAPGGIGGLSGLLGGLTSFSGSGVSDGWTADSNTGKLDTAVASGARSKFTSIRGGGKDTVTIMVYMCGTDLESQNGMASADLGEMSNAKLSDKVNIIVYTGGCKKWKNSFISSTVNQIYKVEAGGKMHCLVEDDGKAAMTKPETLVSFIKWCDKNYPADRNELIFWDHGGGSLSGYGYDEKNVSSGSMTLSGINKALSSAGKKFDFIGFDACLMATAENALMLSDYADYLIASEETEPGIGWYYTDWLTFLSSDTSVSTLEIGKHIADDFVKDCASRCSGQKATLSVVDLAELKATIPDQLAGFASSTIDLLKNDSYQVVSDARSGSREFSPSSKIDQVDLVDLANRMGTSEGKSLAKAILGAVKYNRTSSNMTNAYGLSIYFPYQKANKVDNAVMTYEAIGMDDEYARCIQQFASLEVSGQAVSGGSSSQISSMLGSLGGSAPSSSALSGSDAISQLLGSFLGGGIPSISGLDSSNTGFLSSLLDVSKTSAYLSANSFDSSALVWKKSGKTPLLTLDEDQWKLVHDLELNVFYDDGQGYLDLGLDNVFTFTDKGELIGEFDGTWVALNDQPVAYYHIDTVNDGNSYTITGRVPVLLNDRRADLILVFTDKDPYGSVVGARYDYTEGETETVAKSMTELQDGDTIDFLCDYYDYNGNYVDNYMIGDRMTVNGRLTISNVVIGVSSVCSACYRFTDIYNQHYWSQLIP